MSKIQNPIIPGYYPDPSICRVGDDFYLCCSSFELYPGIPLFHSKDLMHWEQIANVMSMENDFHVTHTYGAGGVMAPTIRYNKGTYYIINANFADKGNFIVTATDPKGPWSMPHYMDDVPGIDASIFFDIDGKCYIIGTGDVWDNGTGVKERGIWMAEYDIENFRLIGEQHTIFNSAMRGASSPESPHVYHIGDYYYLMIAEGGTEHYHSVAVARSKDIFGFYENNPANPVITHRNMGTHAKIANVGHADFVDTPDGKWYAVMLASRCVEGKHKNVGRETYICPVEFEWGWPLFTPETGKLEFEYEGTGLPETVYEKEASFDDFDSETLPLYWTFWGTPYDKYYEVKDSKLFIQCIRQDLVHEIQPVGFDVKRTYDAFSPFIARRQREFSFEASAKMTFTASGNERAGLAIVQAMNHHYHFERFVKDGVQMLRVQFHNTDFTTYPFIPGYHGVSKEVTLAEVPVSAETLVLKITLENETFTFLYGENEEALQVLTTADARLICTEQIGCMVGTMIGMFATGAGETTENKAAFDYFNMVQ